MNTLIGDINAFVRSKCGGKKGKGKGKGQDDRQGKGKDAANMDVDTSAESKTKRLCYECGDENHIGRDCPIRQARVAAGGPPILPKGKGKGDKGGGKAGKGQPSWPTAAQWRSYYPGPSPTQWNSWYQWTGKGAYPI